MIFPYNPPVQNTNTVIFCDVIEKVTLQQAKMKLNVLSDETFILICRIITVLLPLFPLMLCALENIHFLTCSLPK